jgi:hypothetical protein
MRMLPKFLDYRMIKITANELAGFEDGKFFIEFLKRNF